MTSLTFENIGKLSDFDFDIIRYLQSKTDQGVTDKHMETLLLKAKELYNMPPTYQKYQEKNNNGKTKEAEKEISKRNP